MIDMKYQSILQSNQNCEAWQELEGINQEACCSELLGKQGEKAMIWVRDQAMEKLKAQIPAASVEKCLSHLLWCALKSPKNVCRWMKRDCYFYTIRNLIEYIAVLRRGSDRGKQES